MITKRRSLSILVVLGLLAACSGGGSGIPGAAVQPAAATDGSNPQAYLLGPLQRATAQQIPANISETQLKALLHQQPSSVKRQHHHECSPGRLLRAYARGEQDSAREVSRLHLSRQHDATGRIRRNGTTTCRRILLPIRTLVAFHYLHRIKVAFPVPGLVVSIVSSRTSIPGRTLGREIALKAVRDSTSPTVSRTPRRCSGSAISAIAVVVAALRHSTFKNRSMAISSSCTSRTSAMVFPDHHRTASAHERSEHERLVCVHLRLLLPALGTSV